MRGGQVFWGRANEAGGAPPFWPWVQIGRSYRAQNVDDDSERRGCLFLRGERDMNSHGPRVR